MIWRLVWKDWYCRSAWYLALLCVIDYVSIRAIPEGWESGGPHLLLGSAFLGIATLSVFGANLRITGFEGSLPVSMRDRLKSRLFSLLVVVWLPTAVMAGLARIGAGDATLMLDSLKGGAALTATVGAMMALRGGRVRRTAWIVGAGLLGVAAAFAAHWIPGAALVGAALIGLAIALRVVSHAPQTFETALTPATAQIPERRRSASGRSLPVRLWLDSPFGKTACIGGFLALLTGWLLDPLVGGSIGGLLFGVGLAVNNGWVANLPISRRRLFAMMLLPCLAISAAAWYANSWKPRSMGEIFPVLGSKAEIRQTAAPPLKDGKHPRIQALELACTLASAMFAVFGVQLLEWRRLRGVPASIREGMAVLFVLCVAALLICTTVVELPAAFASARLDRILPQNAILFTAILVTALFGFYRLVCRQFEETDPCRPLPVNPALDELMERWK